MHRVIAVHVLACLAIATSAHAQECLPRCRGGEVCQAGRCIAQCRPPCAGGSVCTTAGCSTGTTSPPDVPPQLPTVPPAGAPGLVPDCRGSDADSAEQARDRGRDLYRRAVENSSAPDLALMVAALQEFDRQCAAGDETALELRASALVVLGRHVEAARTIDAFLRRRPLSVLPAEVRARIEGNLPLFFARVGSIRVVTNAPSALARIGEAEPEPVDGRLLRVEPGTAQISVWAPGAVSPVTQPIVVHAGQVVEARFALEPARPHEIPERAAVSDLPASSGAGPSVPIASAPRGGPEDAEPTELHLAPWAVTAGVLGGLLLAAGGVAVAIHFERADLYESERCPERPFMPGCEEVLGEFELAGTLRTAFFIAGGVLAAASLALVIVDVSIGGDEDEGDDDSGLRCAAAGPEPAIACRARF